MPLIHVVICFNSLILVIHMDLVAALGGIPGAFFLPFLAPLAVFLYLRKIKKQNMSKFNPYIKHIDTRTLQELCIRYGQLSAFRKGEYLIREGDTYPYFGFVKTGIFKYVSENKAKNRLYNTGFAFPGEFVADYPACIYGMRSETNVQALTRCEIYLCPVERLTALCDQQPGIARINAEQLFLQTYSRYLDLYRLTPEERYLQLLERCPDILQSVPLQEIASYLMITPTHMSRIRRKQSFG